MRSSSSEIITLTVVVAIGYLASLFVSKSLQQIFHSSPRPQLQALSVHHDPKTAQLRSDLAAIISDVGERSQSDADAPPNWWEDINYERISCGKSKCYFRRVSDPAKGYLVWDCMHSAILRKATKAYNYASSLESKYNVRHFSSSPPYKLDTPEYFAERVNAQEAKKYRGTGSLVIQESINAPEGSRLFKCKGRDTSMYDDLEYMIAHGNKGYEHVLLEELSYTSKLLESEPGLALDFEFMMDLNGRIYHLDLDRALVSRGARRVKDLVGAVSFTQTCLENAANYIRSSMGGS